MISGFYFDGKTSDKKKSTLQYDDQGNIRISDTGADEIHISSIKISSRLANTPRYLNFPDGSLFETTDNDAIDKFVATFKPSFFNGVLHSLESTKAMVISSVSVVILFGWLLIQYGIPHFSKEVANMLPTEASQYMGQGVLEIMDKNWFEETKLSIKKQDELRLLFSQLLDNIDESDHYKLEFRLGGPIQANAFALPNGTIVFTDELINLAENNLEIAAIMLHEAGHVKHHHSLRSTIQQFSLAMFVMVVSGDVSTSSSIVSAIPLMLVESGYSQNMESEADTFSLNYMLKHNINPNHFVTIMEKLEASYSDSYDNCMEDLKEGSKQNDCLKEAIDKKKKSIDGKNLTDYFSTHPNMQKRIEKFRINQYKK